MLFISHYEIILGLKEIRMNEYYALDVWKSASCLSPVGTFNLFNGCRFYEPSFHNILSDYLLDANPESRAQDEMALRWTLTLNRGQLWSTMQSGGPWQAERGLMS